MRTTLNLDDDVAAQLAHTAATEGTSLSRAANHALRTGLRSRRRDEAVDPYEPPAFDTGRPLIEVTNVAEALEALEGG